MLKVSITGGSGYAGGELTRILLSHAGVEINQITSERFVGENVTQVHPNLRGQTDLQFDSLENLKKCDLLFAALPNGESMKQMRDFLKISSHIIDLGADFRLRSVRELERWYGQPHTEKQLVSKFVYGLAELNRRKIKKARLVACGGCEATAVILALHPLAKEGLIKKGYVIADVKIGSSAAGNKPSSASHHPERHGVLRSYKPTNHRHQAEIKQEIGLDVDISATAVNIVRGILVTIHTQVKSGVEEKDIWKAFRKVYENEPFIRIVKQKQGLYRYPEPKLLWGTNYCDVGFEKDSNSNRLVVISAIDNLVKGTAGQAIQAMNVMFNFPETTGLEFRGLHPV